MRCWPCRFAGGDHSREQFCHVISVNVKLLVLRGNSATILNWRAVALGQFPPGSAICSYCHPRKRAMNVREEDSPRGMCTWTVVSSPITCEVGPPSSARYTFSPQLKSLLNSSGLNLTGKKYIGTQYMLVKQIHP